MDRAMRNTLLPTIKLARGPQPSTSPIVRALKYLDEEIHLSHNQNQKQELGETPVLLNQV
jgi:hypothetical protein